MEGSKTTARPSAQVSFFNTQYTCNKRRETQIGSQNKYRCLDRESNPRPLAYGNTASIRGFDSRSRLQYIHVYIYSSFWRTRSSFSPTYRLVVIHDEPTYQAVYASVMERTNVIITMYYVIQGYIFVHWAWSATFKGRLLADGTVRIAGLGTGLVHTPSLSMYGSPDEEMQTSFWEIVMVLVWYFKSFTRNTSFDSIRFDIILRICFLSLSEYHVVYQMYWRHKVSYKGGLTGKALGRSRSFPLKF
jgi:hypothetical protein